MAIAAKNRLTYRVQRQEKYCVRTPPRMRPTAPPPPATDPNTPNARPRSRGLRNVLTRVPRADGARMAPKMPCSARAVTSISNDTAAPPSAEDRANPTSPVMKTRLRLNMSPSRPPTSSRLPNARAYAVTTHCRSLFGKPRACWADGSAMFTMVASSTTISWAMATRTRRSQRWSLPAERWAPVTDVTDDIVSWPPSEIPGCPGRDVRSARRSCGHRDPVRRGGGLLRPFVKAVEQAQQRRAVVLAQYTEDLVEHALPGGVRHVEAGLAHFGDGHELGPAVGGVRPALGQGGALHPGDA